MLLNTCPFDRSVPHARPFARVRNISKWYEGRSKCRFVEHPRIPSLPPTNLPLLRALRRNVKLCSINALLQNMTMAAFPTRGSAETWYGLWLYWETARTICYFNCYPLIEFAQRSIITIYIPLHYRMKCLFKISKKYVKRETQVIIFFCCCSHTQ